MTPRFTCGIVDIGASDAARVGGKAAALGELARAGLPVPRGSALVSGEVTPDSFTVSKVTGEITGRRPVTARPSHRRGRRPATTCWPGSGGRCRWNSTL